MPDPDSQMALAASVYDELRRIARGRMSGQPVQHTLEPTALVNEAILRLMGTPDKSFVDEAHFVAAAAEAMRHVLIDHARRKSAVKRGGRAGSHSATPVSEMPGTGPAVEPEILLDLNDALGALEENDPELATIVKLRVFSGLTTEEIGALLGVARKTVERRWRYAAAALRMRLDDEESDDAQTGSK